ncbi:MAG: hypothetical protein KKG59_03780 [Nanoarchaeota archaeon]|nr:hypothetical protein [Nanoarchaeota archaeon]
MTQEYERLEKRKNEDLQVERIGHQLDDYSIGLCVTGGIAAIEVPKIARHLRRYGANVNVYTTYEAHKFVGEASLQWGSGNPVVTELSGNSEHICLEDIVLVAPATTNTINKIFSGIADNPVTTLIASALGKGVPVYLAPTMHETLYQNPMLQENLEKSEKYGINIIPPRVGEGKAKMPRLTAIVNAMLRYAKAQDNPEEEVEQLKLDI